MRRSAGREFLTGVGLLFQGLRVWASAPSLMVLGMVPALIVAAAFAIGVVALAASLQAIVEGSTPFAEPWPEPWRTLFRLAIALATLGAGVLLAVTSFTTVTLIVGDPFYERIWAHTEGRFGTVPRDGRGFWTGLAAGVAAGLRLLLPTIGVGILTVLIGLIPAVGAVLAAIVGALLGGRLLAGELMSRVFDARGIGVRERLSVIRSSRASAMGFGAATYLCFLIPLGAVIMMPAAVAGATLLARRMLGEESTPPRRARASAA